PPLRNGVRRARAGAGRARAQLLHRRAPHRARHAADRAGRRGGHHADDLRRVGQRDRARRRPPRARRRRAGHAQPRSRSGGAPDSPPRARIGGLHGMSREAWTRYDKGGSWYYEVVLPGFKYNMTDIQAALGVWQLRKLERHQARRRAVVALYDAAFAGEPALELPVTRPEVEHAWHLYVLRLRPEALRIDRDRFITALAERNIG